MGNREENLLDAVAELSNLPQTRVAKLSDIYETEPVGYVQQDRFLNMAVALETRLEPFTLLKDLQGIEKALKRERKIHWGPRTIDIDILLYDSVSINCESLEIPHPRMFERAFVLIPLRDIYPYKDIKGNNIDNLIEQCGDKNGIRLYKSSSEFFRI
jgi:2-amino-4-hydroxy-6-hydroxymethyldihydropteridine diphosphokinase